MPRCLKLGRRNPGGFTVFELLVIAIIIAILAGVILPILWDTESKARLESVKANMRKAQIAAESYATDNGGMYPGAPPSGRDAFSTYFPEGDLGGKKPGRPPTNPFTNKAAFDDFKAIDVSSAVVERAKLPTKAALRGAAPGQIGYACVNCGRSYAIEGAGADGNSLPGLTDKNTTLVLSNE